MSIPHVCLRSEQAQTHLEPKRYPLHPVMTQSHESKRVEEKQQTKKNQINSRLPRCEVPVPEFDKPQLLKIDNYRSVPNKNDPLPKKTKEANANLPTQHPRC